MTSVLRVLLMVVLVTCSGNAQVQLLRMSPGPNQVALEWQGGGGPFQVETSPDLRVWSDQGDPLPGSRATLAAFRAGAFYRVVDLDPAGVAGTLFGLLQTDQGEFGELFGRHRLKSRFWLHLPRGPAPGGNQSPAAFWRKLVVRWQHLEGGVVRTWTGPLESLGSVATPGNDRVLTVTWARGEGASVRTYQLSLEFPYPVNAARALPFHASDPYSRLKCTYATPQPEFDFLGPQLRTTREDSTGLIELAPLVNGWAGVERKYSVSKNGARVDVHFLEGMPLMQGEPPWILKTYSLDRWLSPVATAGTLPPLGTDSYFSRTLLPGHHNFYAIVLIEPELDPALSADLLATYRQQNIRFIYTFKDLAGVTIGGDEAEDIRFIGFDGVVRRP